MAETTGKGQENMRPIEELLERLHDEGLLDLPERSSEGESPYAFIEPSKAAKAVAERVRQRVLAHIGLSDVGAYIARERKAQDIKPQEISKTIKLSSEVLTGIETSRLQFFDLSFRKAADLVEVLSLDPSVVLRLLGSLDLSLSASEQPAPLLRTDTRLPEDERVELEKESLKSSQESRDRQAQLEEFVEKFTEELSRRGIMK